MIFPDFFIIGAAKSGTTSIYKCLEMHPDLIMSSIKEPEFFSDDKVFDKGLEWYSSLFELKKKEQICGEASTTYSRYPHTPDVPSRIKNYISNPKFVYIIRNPIERTYSHYCHHMRLGVTKTFEQALKDDEIYVNCSLYAEQIKQYLLYFPMESILVLLFEDFIKDRDAFLGKIQSFLGLEVQTLKNPHSTHANERHQEFVRKYTTGWVRGIPIGNFIANRIPKVAKQKLHNTIRSSFIGEFLVGKHRIPPMLPETKSMLLERFKEPNLELAELIGRDLSEWH